MPFAPAVSAAPTVPESRTTCPMFFSPVDPGEEHVRDGAEGAMAARSAMSPGPASTA